MTHTKHSITVDCYECTERIPAYQLRHHKATEPVLCETCRKSYERSYTRKSPAINVVYMNRYRKVEPHV